MQIRLRRAQSVLSSFFALLLAFAAMPARAAEKARLRVDDYRIEADLTPHLHQISPHRWHIIRHRRSIVIVRFKRVVSWHGDTPMAYRT